jgi:hypothetical protein
VIPVEVLVLKPNIACMSIAFIAVLGVLATAVSVGVYRHRRFNRWENLHKAFAHNRNLQHNFQHQKRFHHYGSYRDYQVEVKPNQLNEVCFTRFSVAMINPNRKALRIAKKDPAFTALDTLAPIDHPFQIHHDLGDWLLMETNDLLFSSLLLSDDIKISLYEIMKPIPAGLLFIHDEEMVLLCPLVMNQREDLAYFDKALDLLCDIKDELN